MLTVLTVDTEKGVVDINVLATSFGDTANFKQTGFERTFLKQKQTRQTKQK